LWFRGLNKEVIVIPVQADGLVASVMPVVCVIAISAVTVVIVVSLLVREVTIRAIEKCPPEQIPQVLSVLGEWFGVIRWIWPWPGKERPVLGKETDRGFSEEDGHVT
jgi:hypothetical protein